MIHSHLLHKRLGLSCFLALGLALDLFLIVVAKAQSVDQLKPGKPVERHLKGGEKHTVPIQLNTNEYLELLVNQKGIDVVVRLMGPDGKVIQEVDNPTGNQGEELLSFIAEKAGSYTLEIESLIKTAKPGVYALQLEALRTATDQDRATVVIYKLFEEMDKCLQTGKYDQGLSLGRQALEQTEKFFGPEDMILATSLRSLARFHLLKGDYQPAETLYQRSLAIYEKILGPTHPDVAEVLNDLALLSKNKGNYQQAESLYRQSLTIFEKMLGPNHSDVAMSLHNLAMLYRDKGEYQQAEPLFQRSLAIDEMTLGADHPDFAQSLMNLAGLYRLKGDYQRAEPLFQRSLAIREKVLRPDHPKIAESLNGLALLYRTKGDNQLAEPLYRRALAIYEKALGPDHLFVATSLNNLAALYSDTGDFRQAEQLYQRSLAIREKVLGPNHPNVARSLNNLAQLYQNNSDSQRAEVLHQRALAISEKSLGPDHVDVVQSLHNLANLYRAKGDTQLAIQFQARCNDAIERDLRRNLAAGSETQKALYLKKTDIYTDQTLSLHLQSEPRSLEATCAALTVVLRRKGRALDALTSVIETLHRQQTPETQNLLDDYASLVGQISVLTLRGPDKKKPEAHFAYLTDLEAQKDRLEAEIGAKSAEFQAQVTPITLENIQKNIPADGVLVEFVTYQPYDAKTRKYGIPRYAVYVLKPASELEDQKSPSSIQTAKSPPETQTPKPETVSFADLGETPPIDQAVTALRKALRNPKADLARDVTPAAQAMDRLVMKPVRGLVGNARHLLLSPDGPLNLIPFAALMDDQGKFLVENYTLTYLTSGRDLLRMAVKIESQQPPLVIAAPDYGPGPGPKMLGRPIGQLAQLDGARAEGKELKALFPAANLKTRATATEKEFKLVNRPTLVHIATHGYFLENAKAEAMENHTRILTALKDQDLSTEQLRNANPLLRSWLFFAGANQGGSGDNNGVMTALEAAQLNLWGTKLVTLSACDTGLGDVKNGDGVYGLRRALVLAGSESQMMSLWSVSDQATRELMVDYYTRLKAGEGRSEALRNVQLKMLKNPRRQHPFYWASFIQSGEWAPLEGVRKD